MEQKVFRLTEDWEKSLEYEKTGLKPWERNLIEMGVEIRLNKHNQEIAKLENK